MAYLPRTIAEEKAQGQGTNISGSGAGAGAGAGLSNTPGAPAAPSNRSGSTVGINDFLKANAPGSAKLGSDVAENINKEVGEASGAINAGTSAFNTKSDAGRVAYNQGAVDRTINTGTADADFNKLISGSYAGPKSLADVGARSTIDKEVNEAQQKAELAKTQGGRVELLRSTYGRPITTGNQRLNAALLSGSADAIGSVRGAAAGANPLGADVTSAEAGASARAADALASNIGVKNQTLGKVGSYLDEQDVNQTSQLAALRASQKAKDDAALEYLAELSGVRRAQAGGSGGLVDTSTPEGRMKALSATTGEGPAVAGIDPNVLATLQRGNQGLTAQNTAVDPRISQAIIAGDSSQLASLTQPQILNIWQQILDTRTALPGSDPEHGRLTSVLETSVAPAFQNATPFVPAPTQAAQASAPAQASTQAATRAAWDGTGLPPGFESAGLTRAQAEQLFNTLARNRELGGSNMDLSKFYTGTDVNAFNKTNTISQADAQRLSALAAITGRTGYQSNQALNNSGFNFNSAFAQTDAQRNAQQGIVNARTAAELKAAQDALAAANAAAQQKAILDQLRTNQNPLVDGYDNSGGGGSGPGGDGSDGSSSGSSGISAPSDNSDQGNAVGTIGSPVSNSVASAIGAAISAITGVPGLSIAAQAVNSAIGMAPASDTVSETNAQAMAQMDQQAVENEAQNAIGSGTGSASGVGSDGSGDGTGSGASSDGSSASGGSGGIGSASSGAGTAAGDSSGNSEGSGGDAGGSGSSGGGVGSDGSGDGTGSGASGDGSSGDGGSGGTGSDGSNGDGGDGGGGGGGGGGGCVIATALVAKGQWDPSQKSALQTWCEETLHNKSIGEALRRGYQVIGSKVVVPRIRKSSLGHKYLKWSFEQATNLLSKKEFSYISVPNTMLWVSAMLITGSLVSKRYARKTWVSLYRNKE